MKVGVIVAMESELDALKKVGVKAVLSGIGKCDAARACTELILSEHPDCIINTGYAGAMDPGLRLGDVVVGAKVAYHDVWCGEGNEFGQVQGCPKFFEADQEMMAAVPKSDKVHFGLLVSGDQFYIDEVEDGRIKTLYPDALAADMESASVSQVCRHFGIPCICIRVISDLHVDAKSQSESYDFSVKNASVSTFDIIDKLIKAL